MDKKIPMRTFKRELIEKTSEDNVEKTLHEAENSIMDSLRHEQIKQTIKTLKHINDDLEDIFNADYKLAMTENRSTNLSPNIYNRLCTAELIIEEVIANLEIAAAKEAK